MFRKLAYFTPLFGLIFSAQMVSAQVSTGSISGVISDQANAALPGATVTITNLDTEITRTIVSDDQGRYEARNFSLGNYQVRAELDGFQTVVRLGIGLTVGRHAVVDIELPVGEIIEEVIVTGEAPLIETRNSAISGLVEEHQIAELPLNARSYEQLATLQPGVVGGIQGGRTSVRGGSGTALNIGGARAEYNTFQIDNQDANDLWNKTPGGMSGGILGVESIKEFIVLTNSYSAEYGRAAGGVLSVITRSGTNQLAGSVYWFHRNDNLDAANFFDNFAGIDKPEFRRNQFGWSIGGPIVRGKTFFFANYEGFRQSLPTTVTAVVPSVLAREGILPDKTVVVNPKVVPYLELYNLPNTDTVHSDGTADLVLPSTREFVTDYFLGRIDHQLSDTISLTGRYIFEDGDRRTPEIAMDGRTRILESKKQTLSLQFKHIVSPLFVHDFRAGFLRTVQNDFDEIEGVPESLNFIPLPGRVLGQLAVSGMSSIGHSASQPLLFTYNKFQWFDNMTYIAGAHSLRWGVDIRRHQINARNASPLHGRYRFRSLEDFLGGTRIRDFRMIVPGGGRDTPMYIRQSVFGFYLQDDYQMRSNLTLNLGLRYEFITVPTEKDGKLANIDVNAPRPIIGDPLFENPSLTNFAPRIGFAWSPGGAGKTSIRGAFGIFFDQITSGYLQNTMFRVPPFFARVLTRNPEFFPDFYQQTFGDTDMDTVDVFDLGVKFDVNFIDRKPSNPYIMNFNLGVQTELLQDTVVSVSYVGSRGVHLGRATDSNTPPAVRTLDGRISYPTDERRNPNYAGFAMRTFDVNSFYNSLQLSVRKRMSRGFLFQISYTFSHSIDEASGTSAGGDAFATSNQHHLVDTDRKFDRGNSSFDVRHIFTSNYVWDLPFGPGKAFGSSWTGLPQKLIDGWEFAGIITLSDGMHTGVFVSPDIAGNLSGSFFGERPDLVPGASANPIDERNVDDYISADAFAPPPRGTLGNLGRNTVVTPGVATFDFNLNKTTVVSEDVRVQFRFEVFNAFNRANFGIPNLTVVGGSASRPTIRSTFGRIRTTRTTSRQIQLALKILF